MLLLENLNSKRPEFLPVRGSSLKLPVFFPSISSVKTGLNPLAYAKILQALKYPQFLVSAYDISHSNSREEFMTLLASMLGQDGPKILMDSGNYESYWFADRGWSLERFNEILSYNICDLAFCFDNQYPSNNIGENIESILKSTQASQGVTSTATIVPIIHGPRDQLVETVLNYRQKSGATFISLPERTLGDGMLARLETMTQIRAGLNELEDYTFIHLLGTGNPYSLLLFSLAGADSFDGLEWCQTVVDSESAALYHFQHREMIQDNCLYCKSTDLDYILSTLGHNLNFYETWMGRIQCAADAKSKEDLLNEYLSPGFINELKKIWP